MSVYSENNCFLLRCSTKYLKTQSKGWFCERTLRSRILRSAKPITYVLRQRPGSQRVLTEDFSIIKYINYFIDVILIENFTIIIILK